MHFSAETYSFLTDLKANNDRTWFQANKDRYEDHVRMPALQFIADFAPRLEKISPHFVADPRPSGGSLFRIYRDVRFSKDKSPYKTHIGMHFYHEKGRDAHTPGFYLGIGPGDSVVGIGTWHPDAPTLRKIRDGIAEDPDTWAALLKDRRFAANYSLWGEALTRPPKGYDPAHPMIEDLKRKDFVGMASVSDEDVGSLGFIDRYEELCRAGSGFVEYLCDVCGLEF